nr:hypothetical protein [Phaseolus vulgaris]
MNHKDKDEWLKDMRGNLSLVATVIATMTFQSALNPPGGVRPPKRKSRNSGLFRRSLAMSWRVYPRLYNAKALYPLPYLEHYMFHIIFNCLSLAC